MSASATTRPAAVSGLFSTASRQPIPLDHVHVDAHIVDATARVTVRQSYRNSERVPLEIVYTFPVDEGAAVCGFEATVDGVRYAGQVKERDEAFKDYDDALEAGHGGFLLDEERADVFTASLGSVRPGAIVELAITYVIELAPEGEGVRFTLPTTVSPRHAPAEDRAGVGPTPADTLNPPVALDVPYKFSVEMDLRMSGAIRSVQSPTNPIAVEVDGARAAVRLAQREAAMDRDLVIVVAADGLAAPHAVCERGVNGSAVLLSFLPDFGGAPRAAEVTFLVDRSGSMAGTSIEEVRNALQLCLRSLRPGSRFNIVSFGSTHDALFRESRAYDEASLADASAFVRTIEADMGGTEILPALQYVLQQSPAAGLPVQVLVLTDGEVTNTDAVIDLARRHAATARVFTFGIGAGASHHLVKGLARASRGAAEFISPGERIEAKVLRQFKRVFTPALTDVTVDWGQAGLAPVSDRMPPVFDGERVRVYALGDSIAAGTATLRATVAGRPVAFEIAVDPASAVDGDTIATLAARERIRTLEEQGEYLESRGSRQRRARGSHGAAAEIAALGVKYQLASRETSFVAIEHRDTPLTDRAELRRVPVALTSGWGYVREGSLVAPQVAYSMLSVAGPGDAAVRASRPRSFGSRMRDVLSLGGSFDAKAAPEMAASGPLDVRLEGLASSAPARASRRRPGAPRPLDALVALQRADGSWDLTREFADAVGIPLRRLEQELTDATGNSQNARRALATAVALAWLETHAAAERVEWDMLASKAEAYLAASTSEPGPGQGRSGWIDVARGLL